MTPEEMLSAILERMGWTTHEKESGDGEMHIFYKTPEGHYRNELPKLTLDLMHEAEKTLTHIPRIKYKSILNQITRGEDDNLYEHHNDVFATKEQRAEAFCRTLFPERFK